MIYYHAARSGGTEKFFNRKKRRIKNQSASKPKRGIVMGNYILSCCSTADLTKAHFEARDIHYICFHYALGEQEYPDDLGETVPFDEFYRRMEEGEMTRTSQINVEEFVEYFTPFLESGKDIVHVCLSSGISGVYNSATAAASLLKEKFPERKIYIVDSQIGRAHV